MNIPVEGFKMTNKSVIDMTGCAFSDEGSPMLVRVSNVLVFKEAKDRRQSGKKYNFFPKPQVVSF